jgi:hypothetical protein
MGRTNHQQWKNEGNLGERVLCKSGLQRVAIRKRATWVLPHPTISRNFREQDNLKHDLTFIYYKAIQSHIF